mmetsp:Transcript_10087/g.18113  ORF Transcript_10087/g.18113 Transcript_10087/m.18113 type:complete len:308 (+) Transcript_10087:184-1107(+)
MILTTKTNIMCRSFSSKQPTVATTMPSSSPPSASDNCSSTDNDNSSSTISKALAQHLALLVKVIQSQRWSAFQNIALANPRIFQMISTTIPTIDEFKGYKSLLHFCLRHNPPFQIVAKMMSLCPNPLETLRAQDDKGRTPLHIAAACDANPLVIKLLGSADPTACTILDADSRTPLHLACDSSCNLFEDQNDNDELSCPPHRQRETPMYHRIQALLSDSLAASLVEDEDDMNALEYAILSNASLDVVILLQKATMESQQERERVRKNSKKRRSSNDDCGGDGAALRRRVTVDNGDGSSSSRRIFAQR